VCDILNIKFGAGAVKTGAGATRSIIILVEPELEPQRVATPASNAYAPTAPAPNLMFNIGGLSKMSPTKIMMHLAALAMQHC
jgi:hypothetical protein